MANQRRAFKIAEKIRISLANQLIGAADPRFFLVTITSVVISPDLRLAKVYWVTSGGQERLDEVQGAFESAGSKFRFEVGKDLGIRFSPELRFFYDDTLDTVEEIDRLFEKVNLGSKK